MQKNSENEKLRQALTVPQLPAARPSAASCGAKESPSSSGSGACASARASATMVAVTSRCVVGSGSVALRRTPGPRTYMGRRTSVSYLAVVVSGVFVATSRGVSE